MSPLFHPNKEADIQARARIRFSHLYFLKRRSPAAKKANARSARSESSDTKTRTARSEKAATAPENTEPATPEVDHLVVRSTDDGWSLIVDELKTPAWTVSTKKKAVNAATETAKELEAKLVIETASGKVHKTHDYQASA